VKARKLTLAFFGAGVFVLSAGAIAIAIAFELLAFASPVRPWWASLTLIAVMVALPLGCSWALLFWAADSLSEDRFVKASMFLIGALLSPICGCGIGMGLLAMNVLP
jgi:hypothetical protein